MICGFDGCGQRCTDEFDLGFVQPRMKGQSEALLACLIRMGKSRSRPGLAVLEEGLLMNRRKVNLVPNPLGSQRVPHVIA